MRIRCFGRPKGFSVSLLQWSRGSKLQVRGAPFHLHSSSSLSAAAYQLSLSQTDLLLLGRCSERFVASLFWQTERVFRFICTVGQRLQAPDLPCHLCSETETLGSRPSVSWVRGLRPQAFRCIFTVSQRFQVRGLPIQSEWILVVQAPGPRPAVSPIQ